MHHAPTWRVAAALCAAALFPSPARAEGRPDVALRWSVSAAAPGDCPDEAQVRAAVERLTGHPLRSPRGARVPIRIDAAQAEGGAWAVRIAIEHPGDAAPRERRIEGPTCAEVAEAAEVVVAVALTGPGGVLVASPPPPRAPPVEEATADRADRADEPPAVPIVVVPGLRLAAGADFMSLPAPAFGVEVAFRVAIGANRVELLGSAWLPRAADATGTVMASAQIGLYAAGARYCRAFFEGTIDLAGCAGIEAGALLGQSRGVAHPGSGTSPWVAPGFGLIGGWAFTRRFRLVLELSGLIPVVRDTFEIGGLGELYRPPAFTVRSLFGLEASFR